MSESPLSKHTALSERPMSNTAALTETNWNILRSVRESSGGELEWQFFCECGDEKCNELVFLTLDAYVALHDHGGAVLADGHELSQVERAVALRAESEALRRQAEHQVKRARKNLRDSPR